MLLNFVFLLAASSPPVALRPAPVAPQGLLHRVVESTKQVSKETTSKGSLELAPTGAGPNTAAGGKKKKKVPKVLGPLAPGQLFQVNEKGNWKPRNLQEACDQDPAWIRDDLSGLGTYLNGHMNSTGFTVGRIVHRPNANEAGVTGLTYSTVRIFPGAGFREDFLLYEPAEALTCARPMLVVFHKYGVSHMDVLVNTQFIQEAFRRGWYLVAPLSASGVNFSSVESQVNTEAVLDWMTRKKNVDRSRIYGVGFSMGGGSLTNYAARHLDPDGAMFAAMVNHTGGVALKDTLLQSAGQTQVEQAFDFWFGDGTPNSADPFKLARSSVINFDQTFLTIDDDEDLARNLVGFPLRSVRATNDTIPYLMRQNDLFDGHLLNLGKAPGPNYEYLQVPFTGHAWSMLDEVETCDWLATHTLSLPTSASNLVDHEDVYYYFEVKQDQAGAFTPFSWNLNTAANRLEFRDTANLEAVAIDTLSAGLDPTQPIFLLTGSLDLTGDEFTFYDYPEMPSDVLRDGVAVGNWVWDSNTRELTLNEFDSAPHTWRIEP